MSSYVDKYQGISWENEKLSRLQVIMQVGDIRVLH